MPARSATVHSSSCFAVLSKPNIAARRLSARLAGKFAIATGTGASGQPTATASPCPVLAARVAARSLMRTKRALDPVGERKRALERLRVHETMLAHTCPHPSSPKAPHNLRSFCWATATRGQPTSPLGGLSDQRTTPEARRLNLGLSHACRHLLLAPDTYRPVLFCAVPACDTRRPTLSGR